MSLTKALKAIKNSSVSVTGMLRKTRREDEEDEDWEVTIPASGRKVTSVELCKQARKVSISSIDEDDIECNSPIFLSEENAWLCYVKYKGGTFYILIKKVDDLDNAPAFSVMKKYFRLCPSLWDSLNELIIS